MDKVTISFYSKEIDTQPGYTQNFLAEIVNIKKIRDGLSQAAKKARRDPPEFILSILLIPDWNRNGNSYNDQTYLNKKKFFLEEFTNKVISIPKIEDDIDVKVVIEDFINKASLSPEELAYLHKLKAAGSNADMIKTRAIIDNLNRDKHLQLDSNTVVPSFEELYYKTFEASTQKDGINASFYDEYYISAHNKMIYTTPTGLIATRGRLEIHLKEWCNNHQNDDEDKNKNSIYSKVFTRALIEIDYVKEFIVQENGRDKTIYPAMTCPVF
jgi:phage tail tube protein FII